MLLNVFQRKGGDAMELYPQNGPHEDQGEIDIHVTSMLLLILVLCITWFEWSLVLLMTINETINCLQGVNAILKMQ